MNKQKNSVNYNQKSQLKVVLYLRLSDEDRDKLTNDELSESIKNQEAMLRKYAYEQNFQVVGVYNDEDYSGADRDRPNFNKMIKECENGNVDVVLVKTQARFARDIELIDKYVHNKFKEWNVRFLTLLEKIDNTKRETKKTSQITGMVDEWYVEDTSINIRETLKSKREHGEFTGSFAPYGYKRDPENKNHLLIDPIPAEIIKRIYHEYAKGYALNKIVNNLTNDNILSPLEYKMINNCKLKIPIVRDYSNNNSIKKTGIYIVKNHFYNHTRQVLKNLTTIDIITKDNQTFSDRFNIKIHQLPATKTKLFYSTKTLSDLGIKIHQNKLTLSHINFNKNNWILLNKDDTIPKNATCIASYTTNLDRTHELSYEIELNLKENKNHEEFFYTTFISADNINTKLILDTKIRNKYKWSIQTIKKILRDEIYIGNLLQFKTTYVSYKNHKIIYNPKDKWIRYDHAHDPIIEKSTWDEVQNRLKTRKKACQTGNTHLLASKVYCSNCDRVFCKCGKNNENGMAYLCCKDKNTKWSNCDNKKYIKESELQEFILIKINNLLDRFFREKIQIKINNSTIENNLFSEKISSLKKEQLNINKELDNKVSFLQGLYEDQKKGLLDQEEYILLKKKYKENWENLNNRYSIIEKELSSIDQKQKKLKDKTSLFKKYKYISTLNSEIINDFIDKIQIGKWNQETNEREIKIIWNFNY